MTYKNLFVQQVLPFSHTQIDRDSDTESERAQMKSLTLEKERKKSKKRKEKQLCLQISVMERMGYYIERREWGEGFPFSFIDFSHTHTPP